MSGRNLIDSFEKKWCEWSIDETIKWFEFVLNSTNINLELNQDNERYHDYEIEQYSSDSSNDDENVNETDDYKDKNDDAKTAVASTINFQHVKSRLVEMNFNTKRYFPVLVKPFQFEAFGIKNKHDCRLICKKTKRLVAKYPKKINKSSKRSRTKVQVNDNSNHDSNVEGFVQDTS